MKQDQRNNLNSVRLLYQTLENPLMWEKALAALADGLNADHVVLDLMAESTPLPQHLLSARVDSTHVEQLALHPEYPIMRGLVPRATAGAVMLGESIINHRQQARSGLYADVIRPMGGYHSLFAVTPRIGQNQTAMLTACRTPREKCFGSRHRQQLEFFLPHLEAVLRLQRKISTLATEQWWRESVLNALPIGVILLDAQARSCYVNRMAESLLATSSLLSLSKQHGLTSSEPEINRKMHRAILSALGQTGFPLDTLIRLQDPCNLSDTWLRIVPLAEDGVAVGNGSPARVVVFCDGPDSRILAPELLARTFGFSPREAALAQALLNEHELPAAAQVQGIGRETARSQLKSMFAKTDTNRQADLVQVLRKLQRWLPE